VGMGLELAAEGFREAHLNRFASTERIASAFKILREAGIKRTAYNIIGLPDQDEEMILSTIEFNRQLDPDNITVAFYSPFLGTRLQHRGVAIKEFDDYEYNVDAQLRTLSKSTGVSKETLEFYKTNFIRLVREGLGGLSSMKAHAGLSA
jgi:anaerobic magnesium-protoporphyrin IX monomethyl ester cyclase